MHNLLTQQSATRKRLAIWVLSASHFAVGCASPWEKSALLKDSTPDISRIQGPTQRSLANVFRKKQDEEGLMDGDSLKPIKGTPEYLEATELFKAEKYDEAQAAFKKVAKKFKKSEIREDALFMEAEAAWKREHYATAHDAYAVLLKEYPSTRHLNVVSERMFKLGRMWLDFPEVANLGEIQRVNFDDPTKALPSEEPPKVPKAPPIFVPNFSDKSKPLFDTPGNGVAALSAVWMNDPTGPLADDAMMLVASYHARKGNYVEADRYFQMLRETFPSSPHVQNAFVLGSHVKLMSYQGPAYDGRTLQEAQLLKESTLKLYPNLPDQERLKEELAMIQDEEALRTWVNAKFYLKKGKKRSAAIFCHEVITQYPKSRYANEAREMLLQLGPEYVSGAAFLTSIDDKKPGSLEQILEAPPSFHLKRYPLVGPERENPYAPAAKGAKRKSKTNVATNTPSTPPRRPTQVVERDADEDDETMVEDERPTKTRVEPAPKSRRRWPFGSPPEKLPEDSDSDAKELSPETSGRARIR
ncbi:tetratricopeptide repeat protein [Schlesneria paludicola]|uniref:tetratricopeptide repeat protein n=1 Tax=Schlesneria paludicola TaxID=360056 RepID=UPI00029B20D7|nr:outer membrane protein assembly factor BamD [Schlesneria paludicola]